MSIAASFIVIFAFLFITLNKMNTLNSLIAFSALDIRYNNDILKHFEIIKPTGAIAAQVNDVDVKQQSDEQLVPFSVIIGDQNCTQYMVFI